MFSKASAPKSVTVRLVFSAELYADPFVFTLRRTSRKEKDSADQLAAVGAAVDPVDWLADMLTAPPEGFVDFPEGEDPPLATKVRSYFLDVEHPELIDIAQYVREAYFRTVLPSFLFR